MLAREYECRVSEILWLTPTVFSLRFEPTRRFSFEPGQFLSVIVPGSAGEREARRMYSFSSGGKFDGYELCVEQVSGGKGSCYLASLKPGDVFRVSAPYGDFLLRTEPLRNVCFVATGTGIAPFKAMILSEEFKRNPPAAALLLFGARTESDILFPGLFEKNGVEVAHAVSQPGPDWKGFKGRVTDFFKALPEDWPWQETDFYLCGNPFMIRDVRRYLQDVREISSKAIRQEAYFSTHQAVPRIKDDQKAA